MPSFKLLPDLEVEALTHYVKYLSIRGEVERSLLKMLPDLEPGTPLVSIVQPGAGAESLAAQQAQLAALKDVATDYISRWAEAAEKVTPIPPRPVMTGEELAASRLRGRDLFYGTVANCVKCHGDSALGDGQQTDFDEWTKEFIGDGKDRAVIAEFVSVGLPQPRNIKPRNLRMGIYRGGLRPIDIFWRVRNGIEGTPMPAATLKPEGDPAAKGLTQDDIWDIVNYVQSLPFEPISNPFDNVPSDLRERM
jgi:mono/diheme cytochrome c family protein